MKIYFAHEKLAAYQVAIEFLRWSEQILERVPKGAAVHGQLDRARTSIPLSIAEGNGKTTTADKCKYFDNAHGSALECASCLNVLFVKAAMNEGEVDEAKMLLSRLIGLLIGLINSKAPERFMMREEAPAYRIEESGNENGSKG
jgi:four helix bundle protein